jgi:hypothetical protein
MLNLKINTLINNKIIVNDKLFNLLLHLFLLNSIRICSFIVKKTLILLLKNNNFKINFNRQEKNYSFMVSHNQN